MKTIKMKASELKPKQEFKLPGRRKFRSVFKVIELINHDHIPPIGRKVCIILNKCKSMILLKDTEVIIKTTNP
jgi:hypothetical protein